MKSSANVKSISTLCIFLSYFLLVSSAVSSHREKRGASVYPVFQGGNNYGHQGSGQNNFLQYLGASPSSSRYGSSGGSHLPSASSYSFSMQPAPSSSMYSSTPLDFNLLNSYAMSTNHLGSGSGSGTGSGSGSSGGWSPNLGYMGSFYTTDYGLLSPNFATMPMPSFSSGSGRNTHTPTLPSLSPSSLAHSASMSFAAQNHLYDVLLSGSSPSTYKGSMK